MTTFIIIFIVAILMGIKYSHSKRSNDLSDNVEVHHHFHKPTYTLNGKVIDNDPDIEKLFNGTFNDTFKKHFNK